MAEKFVGTYKLESSENFDEYMKAIGVGLLLRTAAASAPPTVEISIDADGQWTMKTLTMIRNLEIKFKLNEEMDETTPDGRKCKTTFTMENGKLMQKQKPEKAGEKETLIIREVLDDKLVATMPLDDLVCKRIYKRV